LSKEKDGANAMSFDEKLVSMIARKADEDYDSDYQFIELDMSGFDKMSVDKALFKKGMDSVAEVCGAICALSNVGVSPESAMAYIASKYEIDTTYKMQIELSDDINKTSVKVAELSGEAQMKQQI